MMKRWSWRVLIALLGILPTIAFAQSGAAGFPQGYAGAVLSHDMYNFYMERNASYLNRPMTPMDVNGVPDDQVAPIHVEPGVIPYHSRVQGVLVTPSGHIMITPGGE